MDTTANYIASHITGKVENKHPYFDFDDEYDEFSSTEDITDRLIEILQSDYSFSDVCEVETDEPSADHICTIKIAHKDIDYYFTVEFYICSRGYKYLNVTI
jgi:hypothetical protein